MNKVVVIKLTKRTLSIIFCVVWLGTASVFFYQACLAYRQELVTLPLYSTGIPIEDNVCVGGVCFQNIINGLIDSYNKNITSLQETMRGSETTSFWLDIISMLMSLFGLSAQAFGLFYNQE